MEIVNILLERVPDLKVIHLLRDPRAMVKSRKNGGFIRPYMNLTEIAQSICQRFERDIEIGMMLRMKYPGRFKTYLYEQIAEHPKEASDSLLTYMELTKPESFDEWLYNHTSSGISGKYYDTIRPNSTLTAASWRLYMPYEEVKTIDEECRKFYNYSGILVPKSNNDLTNLHVPLRTSSPIFGDYK